MLEGSNECMRLLPGNWIKFMTRCNLNSKIANARGVNSSLDFRFSFFRRKKGKIIARYCVYFIFQLYLNNASKLFRITFLEVLLFTFLQNDRNKMKNKHQYSEKNNNKVKKRMNKARKNINLFISCSKQYTFFFSPCK